MRAVEEITVEVLREDFDFEGCAIEPFKLPASPFAAAFALPCGDDEHYLAFTGLGGTGLPLRMLKAIILFSARDGHTTERVVGPMLAGGNGCVYGAVQYPGMKELWPEIYGTTAIRVVEVDLRVEVRSRFRNILYVGTELKAVYRRRRVRGDKTNHGGASWTP